jgi:hypothetical protein
MKTLADLKHFAILRDVISKLATKQPADGRRAHGTRLTRRWVRDPKSGKLVCAWSLNEEGEEDGREPDFRLAA